MSRSNGKFPKFVRLDVYANKWPDNYFDQNMTCKNCGTAWPNVHFFAVSLCCDAPTTVEDGPPDIRWPEAVKKLLTHRFEKLYAEWNEGKSDEELPWEDYKNGNSLDESKIAEAVEQFVDDAQKESSYDR